MKPKNKIVEAALMVKDGRPASKRKESDRDLAEICILFIERKISLKQAAAGLREAGHKAATAGATRSKMVQLTFQLIRDGVIKASING